MSRISLYKRMHQQLLDMLGAKDQEDAARIIAGFHANHLSAQVKVLVSDDDVDFAKQAAYDIGDASAITDRAMRAALESLAARLSQGAQVSIRDLMRNQQTPSAEDRALIANNMEFLVGQGAQGEALTDEAMRAEWRESGGAIHGPNVETVTMPEADYFKLRRTFAAERAAVPDGWVMVPIKATPEMIEAGYQHIDRYYGDADDAYEAMLTAAPQPPEGARVVDDAPSQRRLPKEAHSCVYPNGDGKCQECSDLAEVSIVRERIEQAIREHCSGGDLWLCSHLAAQHVWVLLAAPTLAGKEGAK